MEESILRGKLQQRLHILEIGGAISNIAKENTWIFLQRMLADLQRPNAQAIESLATHIAMALTRTERGGEAIKMPGEILEELSASLEYKKAVQKLQGWMPVDLKNISEDEKNYILIHIVNVLREEAEG